MRFLRRFLARLKNFSTRRQDDKRLREEMEEHLARQTEENLRDGMGPAEARRQAVLKFGAVQAVRETYHAEEGLPLESRCGCLLALRTTRIIRMIALFGQHELGGLRLNALAMEKGGTMKLNRWKARVWKCNGRSEKELPMKKILTQYGVCALALALMMPLAQAQPAGLQTAFGKDAGTLSDKFTALAHVMSGKYDWKPGQGVRSVGDVFNLIVRENGLLTGVLSGTPNTGEKPVPITDPEKMQEALKASYVNLQKAITGLSDTDLQTPVKLFGRDMTKQAALMLILEDQHEHLGQSIAYARTNGVVPPWSK